MSAVATAIVGGAVIGGYMASQATKSAAQTQADAAARAQGQLLATGSAAADLYNPYASKGTQALNMLNYGLGDTSIQKARAIQAPVSNVPAGYSLNPPDVAQGGMPRAYTTVMPSEGNTWAYNNQTGDRIEIPKAVSAPTADQSGQTTVPSDIGFDRGYFTRQFNNQDLNANLAPGYEFRLKQGAGANLQASNVTGGAVSGNALKSMQDYAQNFASGEYGTAFNQFQAQRSNIYSNLQNIANMGLTATTGQANAMIGTGTNIANITSAAGNAQAASQIAQGNIYGGMANTAGNAAAYYAMNQNQNPYQGMGISGNQNTGYAYQNQVGPTQSGGNLSTLNVA
jgi:hypothetical protein